jgi:MFS family permease
VSGPILGGVIADNIGWRWSFWINIPIASISIFIIIVLFPKESTRSILLGLPLQEKIKRLDLIGASLLISGLICLSCTLQTLSTSTDISKSGISLGTSAAGLLAAFLLHEWFINAHISLIPRNIFAIRTIWTCCCGLFFLFAGFINYIFFLSIFFQVHKQSNSSSKYNANR